MDTGAADLALRQHQELTDYALPFGAGAEWRSVRERAEGVRSAGARERLHALDTQALEWFVSGADVWPGLLEDDPSRPLTDWWWHLGAIRAGTYPPDLLPEHLRAVYRAAADQTS